MRRIIVMRPGALGDALLMLPALAALRAAWPGAHLTCITRADVLPLLQANQLADAVYPFDLPSWAPLWGDLARGDDLLTRTLADADALVAWLADPDAALRRNAAVLGVRRLMIAPGRPPAGTHATLHLLRTLAPLDLDTLPTSAHELTALVPPLRPPPSAEAAAGRFWDEHQLGEHFVVALHPGSGGAAKCWPAERFAALARQFAAAGRVPLLIEGPADERRAQAMLAALSPALAPPVLRHATVADLAAVLARCAAYVGNDSGVTHLAALLGVATLALFGPSDPAEWAPVGRRVRVLRADETRAAPMTALGLDRVWTQVDAMLRAPDSAHPSS